MSSLEFIGQPGIKHVAMPEDSELCFVACVAAASGATISQAQEGLAAAGILNKDGSADAPEFQNTASIDGKTVVIEPVETPYESSYNTNSILERVEQQLRFCKPVALLALHYKAGSESFQHWTLVNGLWLDEGGIDSFEIMDPLKDAIACQDPDGFTGIIDRSLPLPGAYAYGLNVSQA